MQRVVTNKLNQGLECDFVWEVVADYHDAAAHYAAARSVSEQLDPQSAVNRHTTAPIRVISVPFFS